MDCADSVSVVFEDEYSEAEVFFLLFVDIHEGSVNISAWQFDWVLCRYNAY